MLVRPYVPTNRSDWIGTIRFRSKVDGSLIDMSAFDITLQITRQDCCSPVLTATNGNGKITFPEVGYLTFTFRASEMRNLCPDSYRVGMIATQGADTSQILIGTVPVRGGNVS